MRSQEHTILLKFEAACSSSLHDPRRSKHTDHADKISCTTRGPSSILIGQVRKLVDQVSDSLNAFSTPCVQTYEVLSSNSLVYTICFSYSSVLSHDLAAESKNPLSYILIQRVDEIAMNYMTIIRPLPKRQNVKEVQ